MPRIRTTTVPATSEPVKKPARQKCMCCGGRKAEVTHGVAHCKNTDCGAMFWGPFTEPFAGKSRRGFDCFHCGNGTIHPMGKVGDVTVSRCAVCGATMVHPEHEDA